MPITILTDVTENRNLRSNTLIFLPDGPPTGMALFTHGYTSHKGSLLSWASRLTEEGLACALFDLPGHYLGGPLSNPSFEEFSESAHALFESLYQKLKDLIKGKEEAPLILGGHSLGALLAFKASMLPFFDLKKLILIGVGIGMPSQGDTHLFQTPFYKSTLQLRGQLVAPALRPDIMFPWIKKEKENLHLSGKQVHLISGEDDLVVGGDGALKLREHLEAQGNSVTLDRPPKLPHHLPEQAASFIKKFLKKEGLTS